MPSNQSSSRKVARHRDRLRASGLRPVQIWLPDTRAAGFAAEAERQARSVDAGTFAATMAWLEDTSEFDESAAR